MIAEWFINLASSASTWFLGLFGTADPPAFIATVGTFVSGLLVKASGLGAWIPWRVVIGVAGVCLALFATGLGLKAVRWIIGIIPGMGGGT